MIEKFIEKYEKQLISYHDKNMNVKNVKNSDKYLYTLDDIPNDVIVLKNK